MERLHGFDEHVGAFDLGEAEGTGESTAWSVPWSDLMMVMFVLFVVLYVYASTHKDVLLVFTDRPAPQGTPLSSSALEGVIARMQSQTRQAGVDRELVYKSGESGVSVVREGRDVRVTLRGTEFFEQGRTELSPGAADYLIEVADLLRMSHGEVRVVGYADSAEPSGVEAFAFTARRAGSVAAWFIENAEVEPGRFSVVGRGGNEPEVPTTVDNHENINRRVDIIIHVGS